MRRLSTAAALVALGALALAASAQACSCLQRGPEQALRQSDGAIVGELLKVVPLGAGRAEFRYRVTGVYKSGGEIKAGKVLAVRGTTQSAACGLPQATGRRYGLLLAEDEEGHWYGGLCGLIEPRKLRYAAAHDGAPRRSQRADGGDADGGDADGNCAI